MNKEKLLPRYVLDREYEKIDTQTIKGQEIGFYFSDARPDSYTIMGVIETGEPRLPEVLKFTVLIQDRETKEDNRLLGIHLYDPEFFTSGLPQHALEILQDKDIEIHRLSRSPNFTPATNPDIQEVKDQIESPDSDLADIKKLAGIKNEIA